MQGWHNNSGSRRSRGEARSVQESPLANACLGLVDTGLCGLIFVAPLFFGGRHDLGRLVFVTLCALIASAWFCRQAVLGNGQWTRTMAFGVLIAAVAAVGFQLVPFSSAAIERLSPRITALLPLWQGDSPLRLGTWRTLSLTPEATRIALAMLLAYTLLFVTVVQRLRHIEDVERILRWIAASAVFMAGFGLLQYFTSNGRFFWFYKLPYRTTDNFVTGSFANRNHFAHFLALGLGPLAAWILGQQVHHEKEESRRDRPRSKQFAKFSASVLGLSSAMVLVVFAGLLSLSRGGAIALVVALAVAIGIYWRAKIIQTRYFLGFAALGVVLLALLSLYGYEKVAGRLDSLASGSLDQVDAAEGRRRIWAANVLAIQHGGFFGSGAGSHREIYPVYLAKPATTEFTHAENGYLQIVCENGLPGALLLLMGLALIGGWCFRAVRRATSQRELLAAGAVSAGLAASVVHSIVDFVWYIPACMVLAILLAACALRLAQFATSKQPQAILARPRARSQWIGLSAVVLLVSAWMVSELVGPAFASIHWDRYLLASNVDRQLENQQLSASHANQVDITTSREMLRTSMISHLQKTLYWHPRFARAQRKLAAKYLQQFDQLQQHADNAMTVSQIRDAAIASKFSSAKQLHQWLQQALGANSDLLYKAYFHARRAVQWGPLQGEAYLYLANLCFLEGRSTAAVDAYVDQALRVRPHDGDVLFEAGVQQVRSARIEKAYDDWAQAYRYPGKHRWMIINFLAPHIPAAAFLEKFQPDWDTLRQVWRQYKEFGQPDDLRVLVDYATQAAVRETGQHRPSAMVSIFLSLADMQIDQQQWEPASKNLRQAYAADPSNFAVRRKLGQILLRTGQYQAAESHLRWCLARRPDDRGLEADLLKTVKAMDQQQAAARTGSRDVGSARLRY